MPEIEEALLLSFLENSLREISPVALKQLANELNIEPRATAADTIAAIRDTFRAGGANAYKLTVIIVNGFMQKVFGRNLNAAADETLHHTPRLFSGPVGWAITSLMTGLNLAGPAYRVTIPATILIAYLRRAQRAKRERLPGP